MLSNQEAELAVTQIKVLGRRSAGGTDESSMKDIQEILNLMKRFSSSLAVQRVACHALSNMAMQVVAARWIIQKNGCELILKAIDSFVDDSRLCWLASSAIWNLARPPANRTAIGIAGAKAMIRILRQHRDRERVTNTAIGALSNLSLLDDLKDLIAEQENMQLIIAVLSHSLSQQQMPVMTSGAGLLANVAVSDVHAAKLIQFDVLSILLQLLAWQSDDETMLRNTCAALNNLVTADGFLSAFLRARGLEAILAFLKQHSNATFANLLDNCLATVDAESDVDSTSIHYACLHGKLEEFTYLYARTNGQFDINSTDGRNMTCLDYAIASDHAHIVEMLAKLGSTAYQRPTDCEEPIAEPLLSAMQNGAKTLSDTKQHCKLAIEQTVLQLPTDLCRLLVTFKSDVELLHAAKQIDFAFDEM